MKTFSFLVKLTIRWLKWWEAESSVQKHLKMKYSQCIILSSAVQDFQIRVCGGGGGGNAHATLPERRRYAHRNLLAAKCWHLTPLWTRQAAGVGLWISHLVLGLSLIPLAKRPVALRASPFCSDRSPGRGWAGIFARLPSEFNSSSQKAVHHWLPKRLPAESVELSVGV